MPRFRKAASRRASGHAKLSNALNADLLKRFRRSARRATALWLAVAVLNLSATFAYASATPATKPATAEVITAGTVTIDGTRAVSGQTFFSGSTIATVGDTLSTLNLGNLARLELSPATALKLDFSDSAVSGALESGLLRLSVPRGLNVSVRTAGALVVADTSESAVFSVRVEADVTTVSVQTGQVTLRAADGAARQVAAGQVLSTADGAEPLPVQRNNLSGRRAGLLLGVAAAVAVVLIVISGRDDNEILPDDGCVIVPSGNNDTCQ
jgi:ferric-dicitrate binding protein FerR (iron transport regulator)